MFKVKSVQLKEKNYRIFILTDYEGDSISLACRLKDSGRFMMGVAKEEINIQCKKVSKGEFIVDINSEIFLHEFSEIKYEKEVIWLFVKVGNEYYDLKINNEVSNEVKKIPEFRLNSLSNINLFIRGNSTLGFVISLVDIDAKITELNINDGVIEFKSDVRYKSGKSIEEYEVCLGKRVFNAILKYFEYLLRLKIVDNEKNIIKIDKDLFDNIREYGIYYYDFMVQVKEDNVIVSKLLKVSDVSLGKNQQVDCFKYKIYKTATNTLALRVEKCYGVKKIDRLNIEKGKLFIRINDKEIDNHNVKIQIYRKSNDRNRCNDILFYEKELSDEEDFYINLDTIFNMDTNYTQYYEMVLSIDNKLYELKNDKSIVIDYKNIDITSGKELIFSVKEKFRNQVNLAILGSCFSRAAFNSKNKYFNLDYKKYIKITYSDFWISLINSYSDPIEYDSKNYLDVRDKDIIHIERLYFKDTFDKMKKEKIDYVLMDLFADAVHGVRKLKNGQYLGQNGYLHKTKYYFNKVMLDTVNFDYRNEQFWEIWKLACDKFVNHIISMNLQDKLILNCSSLTHEYYDKDGKKKSFDKENKFRNQDINYFNKIWDRMNNYLLSKLPNAKVIDLDKYGFSSSYNHPISCGPHHFETAYYKKLKDEVLEIILVEERKNK